MRSPLLKKANQDPALLVQGYGVLRHSQIKTKVKSYLEAYVDLAKKENWSGLYYYSRNGVLEAMLKTLADFSDHKIQPYPEEKLAPMDLEAQNAFKQSRVVSSQEFMLGVIKAASYKATKTAKPEILDQSLLYLKIEADRSNPDVFNVSFFSPKLRSQGNQTMTYQIEVTGGTNAIRRNLNKLVIPQMRDDVLESDHALLEKVVYRLRNVVLESAMEYIALDPTGKSQYKNVVRMDIMKYQDLQVRMHDNQNIVDETLEG